MLGQEGCLALGPHPWDQSGRGIVGRSFQAPPVLDIKPAHHVNFGPYTTCCYMDGRLERVILDGDKGPEARNQMIVGLSLPTWLLCVWDGVKGRGGRAATSTVGSAWTWELERVGVSFYLNC